MTIAPVTKTPKERERLWKLVFPLAIAIGASVGAVFVLNVQSIVLTAVVILLAVFFVSLLANVKEA